MEWTTTYFEYKATESEGWTDGRMQSPAQQAWASRSAATWRLHGVHASETFDVSTQKLKSYLGGDDLFGKIQSILKTMTFLQSFLTQTRTTTPTIVHDGDAGTHLHPRDNSASDSEASGITATDDGDSDSKASGDGDSDSKASTAKPPTITWRASDNEASNDEASNKMDLPK
ncbi:hypothetical protein FA13DRAFT_1804165 [Coprinellus micaceus]|uniref:Uncharacterized protein n=1 Tax=Coprinellus micaceus TaxID=71717 RepID=A0A4Y7SBD4_COPMI|nr:hypothetical protein FA13DRAFT_1804165 [Coprinellus micaceus]